MGLNPVLLLNLLEVFKKPPQSAAIRSRNDKFLRFV
jgi:hypothetical protein